ncbi:Reverse transcriptase (RNA-dependent DNA polymerase) [Lactobacillus helveticus]|uniref:Reverse transcriptase (RNA-dependent DNA polymerase) n=2 Tax=Lactobacillus helveticus TaxID=1587 RepID=A0A6A7K132_LACHE|nr:Reverse transcriptase (RNA-dependent DNA polymerase) [Lactobacillus helveticus]
MEKVSDLNSLYRAYMESKKDSSWKPQAQMYEMDYLSKIIKTSDDLNKHTYTAKQGSSFIIYERGKQRNIRSNPFSDRVIRRAFCDNVLIPKLLKYLVYDNGASLTGKGISFTRHRFEQHLHEYYRKYGTNEGYILLIDFSKYYDNIRHDKLREAVSKHIHDPEYLWLLDRILDNFKVDVSYLSDDQYKQCLNLRFDGEKQSRLNPKYLTGQKYMAKSLAIGDQVSQICSIFFPTPIDNYCKIVRSIRWYGRYMDDSYILSKNKDFLHEMLTKITQIASDLGIFINHKKTRIMKINHFFTWLKLRYKLTESGHLVIKINPKTITRERRKLKKYRKMVDQGKIPLIDVQNSFKSWLGTYDKLLSYRSKSNLIALYNNLFKER